MGAEDFAANLTQAVGLALQAVEYTSLLAIAVSGVMTRCTQFSRTIRWKRQTLDYNQTLDYDHSLNFCSVDYDHFLDFCSFASGPAPRVDELPS